MSWSSNGPLAAAVAWDEAEQRGVVWTNRRLMHGRLDDLIWRWALHRVWIGKIAAVLTESDLRALPSEFLAAVV